MPAANSASNSVQQLGFDTPTLARLNTHTGPIALDLRKGSPNYIDGDGELRIGNKGSLSVNPDGRWYDFEVGIGGRGSASLILHHMDGAEARQYAIQWLAIHQGNGTFAASPISDSEQEEKDRRNAENAREVLGRKQPITPGTDSHAYCARRHLLDGPLPACVAHLQSARTTEGAIVGVLTTADGEEVAVQLGYLLADGDKSPFTPNRRQFAIDKERAKGAMFNIPATPLPTNGMDVPDVVRKFADSLVLCEGIEDAMSLHRAFPYSAIGGLPGGIGRAVHLKVHKNQKILVFADGDAEDSRARKSLTTGVDSLIIAGAEVRLAMPPLGTDANDLLVHGGVEAIHAEVAKAVPAVLSKKGRLAQICRMPWVEFKLALRDLAKELHTNSPFLEAQWKAAHKGDQVETSTDGLRIGDDTAWSEPVNDIAAVCDEALAEVQRYVIANEDDLAVSVIWDLGGHFVHHEVIHLTRYPRLEIGGEDIEVGKTTALEISGALLPRTLPIGGSITAAAYYRLVDAHKASVLIDEAHDLFKSKDGSQSHLLRILRSGHTRKMAYVLLTEPSPDGKHVLRQFSTWAAIAYTVIGRLPDAGTRSRSISIRLIRALEGEVTADFDEGDSPVLDAVRQKFTRWAADQTTLPMVTRPAGIFNRRWNNWAPLMRIAALVGGSWLDRITRAAQRALVAPTPTNSDGAVAALTDIRILFDTPVRGTRRNQIESGRLCQELVDMDEPSAEWKYIRRGQPITPLYLRERLRGLLNPPGSQRWKDGSRIVRGYRLAQFEDAFRRYLPPLVPQEDATDSADDIPAAPSPERPVTPGTPATGGNSGSHTNEIAGDGSGDGSRSVDPSPDLSPAKPLNTCGKSGVVTGVPGVTGQTPPPPHVFPDGTTLPWDGPSTPVADPKKEELW